ncbi:RnfABCDGE type electron transport complex subunit G [bacterium]|nr:RnfABCDGE type electron transport complex subunit G [candidate division CSSED10-310 bacterium]
MKGFKDVIILILISTISGFCLSLVYAKTQAKIEAVKQESVRTALKNVADFMTDDPKKVDFEFSETETIPIYDVTINGEHLGAALEITTPEGFSGNIVFLMGVNQRGEITGFQILDAKETPGLGTKAADKAFWGQFVGRSLDTMTFKVKKDGGDVDAITASTITSRAVTHALEKGLKAYQAYRGGA